MSLQELNLGSTQIHNSGTKELATALQRNTSLRKLDLYCNHIGDDGIQALAAALQVNPSSQELTLYDNAQISNDGMMLATALQPYTMLQFIDLRYCRRISNDVARMMAISLGDTLPVVTSSSSQEDNISINFFWGKTSIFVSIIVKIM